MITLQSLAQSAMFGVASDFKPTDLSQVNLSGSDPETAMLASAAIIGVRQSGGAIPMRLEPNITPCPEETRPQIPGIAADLLKRLLVDGFEALLPEFLHLAAARGLVLPPETLPALFGSGNRELRSLVAPVGGMRGAWLARHNPAWAYARTLEPQEAWENGTQAERIHALEQMRAVQPALARAWLQSTWRKDNSEDRAAFLQTLESGLSMEDEPLLETCLDDRRKEVRDAARKMLLRLEESRFSQRMWARARPLLDLKSKFLGRERLEATLPEEFDALARRDGIGDRILRGSMGKKANLLAQTLSFVPPASWSREFGRNPEKLVSAAANGEWKEAILLGWQLAARNAKDAEWTETLITFWVNQQVGQKILDDEHLAEDLERVHAEKVEKLVVAMIKPRTKELEDNSPLLSLLEKYRRPWTAQMARTVIHSAQRQSGKYQHRLPLALPSFAQWVLPDLADEFSADWAPEPIGNWRRSIDQFLIILRLRSEIQQSFR